MAGGIWIKGATRNSQDKMVQLAKEDLAEYLGIPETDLELIKLVEVTAVTWKDPDLGYPPRAGSKKQQGLTPGFLIYLSYSGREYQYHSSFSRVVFVPAGKGQTPLPASAL
jgi:hypothetical protein